MLNAKQAAALEVSAAGESDASVPCCAMHERMSVAMALAESRHHSAQRQKMARAGGEARVALHGRVPDAPPPQGSRPPSLGEPRPQDQHQLRTMQQTAAYAPVVQILDVPVPQMVVQLSDVMRFFDTLLPVPEQDIEVPKILLDDVPMRTAVHDTQLAEQLVEVPTIVSYSSLQRIMEQHVDIPVPGGGGPSFGLQGFSYGQSSTASPCKKRISERIVEQNVDFPVGGGLQDFRSRQGSSSSSHVPARVSEALDEPGSGVFSTFHPISKSAKLGPHSSPRVRASVSSSTLAAQLEDAPVPESNEWVQRLNGGKAYCWNRRTNAIVWQSPPGVNLVWVGKMDEEEVPPLPPG